MNATMDDAIKALAYMRSRVEQLGTEIDQDKIKIMAMQEARAAKLEECNQLEQSMKLLGKIVSLGGL